MPVSETLVPSRPRREWIFGRAGVEPAEKDRMRHPACKRLARLTPRVAAALALVVAPCLLAPGKVTKLGSIAYANNGNGGSGGNGGNGNGGSSAGGNSSGNSNAGGNSGNSNAGGNSGNSNAGGGNPNAGPGNNNGKGNTDPGGKNSYTNTATGDTLSIEGDKITVIHRNGMKEKVQNGRFEMTDALGRTIVDRLATQEDVSRLLNL